MNEDDVRAVEADLVAHVAALHRPPNGELHENDDAVWFLTGGGEPHDNGILRASLPEGGVGEAIDRLLSPFRERGLPMMWWFFTGPESVRPEIGAALREAGLELEADLPAMVLDLADWIPPLPPAGCTTERVRDDVAFDAWADVIGRAFEDPAFADGRSARAFRSFGFDVSAPFRHYLCRSEGAWVGGSTLSLAGEVAGLANIAVIPERRGLGLGAAIASAALDDARQLGIEVGALSADRLGLPLYEKLGFRTVGRHLTYVWRPSPEKR